MHAHRLLIPVALLTLVGCSSLRYELAELPFPVSASPLAKPPAGATTFELKQKHILWGYGLFGESQPDVQGAMLAECLPCAGVADFRVTSGANFWDWLGTHLSLGLVRLKTVKVTGLRLPANRG
jgi:hypothetical protein